MQCELVAEVAHEPVTDVVFIVKINHLASRSRAYGIKRFAKMKCDHNVVLMCNCQKLIDRMGCTLCGKKTAPFYFCNNFVKTLYSEIIIDEYIIQ